MIVVRDKYLLLSSQFRVVGAGASARALTRSAFFLAGACAPPTEIVQQGGMKIQTATATMGTADSTRSATGNTRVKPHADSFLVKAKLLSLLLWQDDVVEGEQFLLELFLGHASRPNPRH